MQSDTMEIFLLNENDNPGEYRVWNSYFDQSKKLKKITAWYSELKSEASFYFLNDLLILAKIEREKTELVRYYYAKMQNEMPAAELIMDYKDCPALFHYCNLLLQGRNLREQTLKTRR